ncbi:DUF4385 family protein [Microdochium nivale]|nr:DUF4385 family protein [Microdochium nivale]
MAPRTRRSEAAAAAAIASNLTRVSTSKEQQPDPNTEAAAASASASASTLEQASPQSDATTAAAAYAPPLIQTTPRSVRMSYRIGRGEQGVLSFEPYKTSLLPLWRFRTVALARKSAADLWRRFERFADEGDFVGMDMARKFIQMGFTRARRYANHAGGRKYRYDKAGTRREELPRSEGHAGKLEKEEASLVFHGVWERCKTHEAYLRLKAEFLQEQKEWQMTRC